MPRPPIRENEVLRILARHGSLSTSDINIFLSPTLSTKRLKALLRELHRKKLMRQMKLHSAGSSVAFWVLNTRNQKSFEQIKSRTKIKEGDVRFNDPHWSWLPEQSKLALIQASIEAKFSELNVYRRHSKNVSDLPDGFTNTAFEERDTKVDLVAGLAKTSKWLCIQLVDCPYFKKLKAKSNRLKRQGFSGHLVLYYDARDLKLQAKYFAKSRVSKRRLGTHLNDSFLAYAQLPSVLIDVAKFSVGTGLEELSLANWIRRSVEETATHSRREVLPN